MTLITKTQFPMHISSTESYITADPLLEVKESSSHDGVIIDSQSIHVTGPSNSKDGQRDDDADDHDDQPGKANDSDSSNLPVLSSDGSRPAGLMNWRFPQIEHLVAEAKGAASKQVVKFIKK